MANELENNAVAEKVTHNRIVRHWARVWLGKPTLYNGQPRVQWTEDGEIEVSVQQYGNTRWMEELQADMARVSKELLIVEAPNGFDSVRLRINLYSHIEGENQKFTLEKITRPPQQEYRNGSS